MHLESAHDHERAAGFPQDHAAPKTSGVAQMALDCLRPTAAVLSILYLLYALAHTQLPRPLPTILVAWALCSSLLLLWLRWELRQSDRVKLSVHLTSAAVAAIVVSHSLARLALTRAPSPTYSLMLLLVGGSFFFLSRQMLIGLVCVVLAGWGLVVGPDWASPS